MTRSERSEINRAAYALYREMPGAISNQAILLKQLGREIRINIELVWNDETKRFAMRINSDGQPA